MQNKYLNEEGQAFADKDKGLESLITGGPNTSSLTDSTLNGIIMDPHSQVKD